MNFEWDENKAEGKSAQARGVVLRRLFRVPGSPRVVGP